MRHRAMAILAALTLVGAGVFIGSGPASAITAATAGSPCDSSDLGRREGGIDTMSLTPALTHFKAYFVTTGTTGSQAVQLTFVQQLKVSVLNETTITAGFSIPFLTKLEANAHFAVTKETQSTSTEQRTLTWNFNQPGYYGVYSGVQKVSGQVSSLQCSRAQKPDGTWVTEWARRANGPYLTWGRDQEGVIRCEDAVPANTIMHSAQIELGCDGLAAQRAARAARAADEAKAKAAAKAADDATAVQKARDAGPAAGVRALASAPSGYVCDPGYYYISSVNGMFLAQDARTSVERWSSSSDLWFDAEWAVCNGPVDATGMQPSVLVNRWVNGCIGAAPGATAIEGAGIVTSTCETVPLRQKLYIYRDVPGSDLIGIQLAFRGAMAGQDELATDAVLRQSEGGMPDGSGTFRLSPAENYHQIVNRAYGQCVDVNKSSTAGSVQLQVWECIGTANQAWSAVPVTGQTYFLVNQNSGYCIDVRNASTAAGAAVQQYPCNGSVAQQWIRTPRFVNGATWDTFKSVTSGLYLDTVGGASSKLMQWPANESATQDWQVR